MKIYNWYYFVLGLVGIPAILLIAFKTDFADRYCNYIIAFNGLWFLYGIASGKLLAKKKLLN